MSSGKIRLKKMETGETTEISIGELKDFASEKETDTDV
jgi:hypothetical protein